MASIESDFAAFFRCATAKDPYAYQRALGEAERPPDVLEVPTGGGKTAALIVSWLYARRELHAGPRRLVYALPMRSLVEQTADAAHKIRERLKLSSDELPIRTLMGGVEADELRDWRRWPECDQIIIGTIDMLLSRALNRGYAESRFAWPVAFGLLNNDCRWIFDEVQLMGSARSTSAQLDGLRSALGTVLPCETMWVSATIDHRALETIDRPELEEVMSLPHKDRSGALRGRLDARKVLERLNGEQQTEAELASQIASAAIDRHVRGTRTLVILNTVRLAQAAYKELQRTEASADIVLLHSRFRQPERKDHLSDTLKAPTDAGTIVVATQVVEAGMDLSARVLLTETAPFSSIVQRLGRCNREGEYEESSVIWIDRGRVGDDAAGRKAAAPYRPADIELSRSELLTLEGESLSPSRLEDINVEGPIDEPVVLRRRDLLDLFDTTPDLSGMDIDIAPFIREDDDRTIAVFFRDLPANAPPRIAGKPSDQTLSQPEPERDELVQIPHDSLGKRMCWIIDRVNGGWAKRAARDVPPGATVMLRAAEGGYDAEIGWDGKTKRTVEPLPPEHPMAASGIGDSDPQTETHQPQELLPHLTRAAKNAKQLSDALGLGQWRDVLFYAGALHDLGKAHPAFQKMLRTAIFGDHDDPTDKRLFAKSGKQGGKSERCYFRHELASALAIRGLLSQIQVPERDLTTYLVAAHHGKVRLSIRPAADEGRPRDAVEDSRFALGIVDGDRLPSIETPIGNIPDVALDLSPMELGAEGSWTDMVLRLREDTELGPFRLGFLEALLRIADWRASSD